MLCVNPLAFCEQWIFSWSNPLQRSISFLIRRPFKAPIFICPHLHPLYILIYNPEESTVVHAIQLSFPKLCVNGFFRTLEIFDKHKGSQIIWVRSNWDDEVLIKIQTFLSLFAVALEKFFLSISFELVQNYWMNLSKNCRRHSRGKFFRKGFTNP